MNNNRTIKFFDFALYHNKNPRPGSTKIRVDNLVKYWPEASYYKYGDKADVLIFQKVYCTYDYKFPKNYKDGIKILDVCDPDWTQTPDIYIKETIDAMDAVVVPTEELRKLLATMTKTPVHLVRDRFDLSEFPERKVHDGKAKSVVWFGYAHNSELIKFAVPSIEARGLDLIIISNEDPTAYRLANDSESYKSKYTFIKYDQETIYDSLQAADVCVLPKGYRPVDKYKSENKTIIAQLCGLPVATDTDELDDLMEAEARNKAVEDVYAKISEEYDCKKSVEEYEAIINGITKNKA